MVSDLPARATERIRLTQRTFIRQACLATALLVTGFFLAGCSFTVPRLRYAPPSGTPALKLPTSKRLAIFVGTVADSRGVGERFLVEAGDTYLPGGDAAPGWDVSILPVPLAVEVREFLISELRRLGIRVVSQASDAEERLEAEVMRLRIQFNAFGGSRASFSLRARLYASGSTHPVWEANLEGSGTSGKLLGPESAYQATSQALSHAVGKLGRAPGFVSALARPPAVPTAIAKKEERPKPAAKPSGPRFPQTPVTVKFRKSEVRPDDVAVIIGNADYEKQGKDIPNVMPAYADAEGMKRYFTQALGVREGNVIDLRDATSAQMVRVFGSERDHRGQLYDWVRPGRSRVYVYYSGHGAPGGKEGSAYLVPADADVARIHLNGYPLATLYRNLGKIPARSIMVVLEACFSGVSQGGSVISRASPVYLKLKSPPVPPNVTVIAAGAANQMASWEKDTSHSLFTKYFLKGMSGEADKNPYGNGDGKVAWAELKAYLKGTLTYFARRYYGRDQVAQIVNARGR